MRTTIVLICCLLIKLTSMQAQPLTLLFGDSLLGEKGIVSHVMPDESIWVIGVVDAGSLGSNDLLAIRIDATGSIITGPLTIGSADLDYPNNMLVQNGQLIIAGERHSATGVDAMLWILDTTGTLISSTSYGLIGQTEQFYDIKATSDGGFIVTGFINIPNGNGNDILVSKFYPTGQQDWQQRYDFGRNEVGVAVLERPDGGYMVAADQAQPNGNYNVLVVGLDNFGGLEWNRPVPSPNNGGCKQMKAYQNQVLVVGEMSTSTSTAFDPYLVRLNWAGDVQWTGTLPLSDQGDALFDVAIVNNNRYLATGYSYRVATGNTDMALFVVDSVGTVLGERYYGGTGFDMAYDIQVLANQEVLLTGFSSAQSSNQIFLVREDLSTLLTLPSVASTKVPRLVLAPNPVQQQLQVLNLPQGARYTATIYTVSGQLLWQGTLPESHQLSVQTLPKGYYHLHLTADQNRWIQAFYKD